jgi:hypothetical protein
MGVAVRFSAAFAVLARPGGGAPSDEENTSTLLRVESHPFPGPMRGYAPTRDGVPGATDGRRPLCGTLGKARLYHPLGKALRHRLPGGSGGQKAVRKRAGRAVAEQAGSGQGNELDRGGGV